jgi:hypothetical protein
MGHLLTIKCVDSRVNVHILALTSVLVTLTTVQVPNLALTHTKRLTVCIYSEFYVIGPIPLYVALEEIIFCGTVLRHRFAAQDYGSGLRHRIAEQDCGTCLLHRITAQVCGTGLRNRIAAQVSGTGLRHRFPTQVSGTGLRHRFAAQVSSTGLRPGLRHSFAAL